LLVSLHSEAAFAASLNVKIRQLNPDGTVQQVTCTPTAKCLLPIDIQTKQGKKVTLTVHILFVPGGNALFKFETPDGYFYAGDKNPADKQNAIYEANWHGAAVKPAPSTTDVTLFLPLTLHAEVGPTLRTSVEQPAADLEITTEQLP
jgi:hypothetical protein